MNIVLAIHNAAGGMGRYVESLAHEYVSRGHHVIVLAPPATTAHYDFPHSLWLHDKSDILTIAAAVRNADALHAHGYRAAAWAWGLKQLAAPLPWSSPTFCVTWHNELPRGRKNKLLAGLPLRSVDALGAVSSDLITQARSLGARKVFYEQVPSPHISALCAQMQEDLSRSSDQVHESQRQARAQLSEDLGVRLDPEHPLILTLARYAPQKDIPTLIKTARELPANIQWLVLGDGDADIAQSLRQAQESECGARIIVGGHYGNIPRALRSSDVFVLTSLWEGHPLVIQEAFAAGVPVVTTNGGGLADLCGDNCALMCNVGDWHALAANIERVLVDPAVRDDIIHRAYEKVQLLPSITRLAETWLDFYKK